MDLIHKFLNILAPPFTILFICFLYPPFLFFNLLSSIILTLYPESLTGKVVIITGASSGIGQNLAYEYGKKGACLALVGQSENALREVVDRAISVGCPDCIAIRADVSVVEDCKRIVDETMSHFGRFDHLVNNAAIGTFTMLEDVSNITDFRATMDVNFWGAVYTTHYAIPHLRNRKGKIVVISSANSWLPIPRNSIYNASKSALVALFETLRIELKPDVKVTIVSPGFMDSESNKGKGVDDQDVRDVQVRAARVEACARRIVRSVRRGEKYVTVPGWFVATYLWKVFCPDVIDWCLVWLYMTRARARAWRSAPTKEIETIHDPQMIKTE